MRKIKFRAWDNHTKVMTHVVSIYSELNGESWWGADVINPDNDDTMYSFDDDTGVLMQFTGLQDKNGVDIYEGDIVQRGVITFSRGKFQGTYYDGGGGLAEDWEDDLYQERDIEVIGNVYENAELLKL